MNEKKILISIAAGTLVIAAALGYGVYYTFGAIEEQETAANTKREEIAVARKKVDEVVKMEDRVIVLRESVRGLASVLPTQKEVDEFVTQIAETKGESGIRLSAMTNKLTQGGRQTQNRVFDKISYQIGLKGSLWQFLEFLHRVESFQRFVTIPRIKITGGQRDKALVDVSHAFEIDVETFVYNPTRAGQMEHVPNYDKRREHLKEEISSEIVAYEQSAIEFTGARGRRDIFVDPRMPETGDGKGQPVEKQQEVVAKLRTRVDEITKIFERINQSQSYIERFELRKELEELVPKVGSEIDTTNKEGIVTYPLLVRTFQNEVKDRYKKIADAVMKTPAEYGPSEKELANIVGRVRETLQNGRLREAVEAAKPVLEKAALIEKDPAKRTYIAELRKLDHDAKVAEKFEQKKVVIGGIVLYEERKAALVNGRTVEPGDLLDDDLTIADIHEDGVTFVLDNVSITKKW